MSLIESFLASKKLAVVGISRSEEKFGTKVYRLLAQHGYIVYGVNPNLPELDGQPVYPTLESLPSKPDGVVVVVPPPVAVQVIKEAARLGIPQVWLQPGSESDEASAVAAELGISLVRDACVMLRSKAARGLE